MYVCGASAQLGVLTNSSTELTERAHTLASAGVAFAPAGKRDGPDRAPSPDTTLWPLNAAALTVLLQQIGASGERSCE